MQLYNNLSAKERAELIEQAGKERLTISFYKYAKINNTEIFRNHLFLAWDQLEVLGRIYVANEGVTRMSEHIARQIKLSALPGFCNRLGELGRYDLPG